jgi:hypothetical protein
MILLFAVIGLLAGIVMHLHEINRKLDIIVKEDNV